MQNNPDKQYNRGILLGVIMISSFFNPFMSGAVNIALPSISEEFSMNAVTMAFLLSSAVITAAGGISNPAFRLAWFCLLSWNCGFRYRCLTSACSGITGFLRFPTWQPSSIMRLTGMMFSLAIATMSIHLFIGEAPIHAASVPGFMNSVKAIFTVFTLLCIAGVFASLARGKKIAEPGMVINK